MARIVLGAVAGFFAWLLVWFGGEQILSAIGPDWYGVHQRAFEAALTDGGPFTANTTLLLIQIPLAAIASVVSGYLAALISREDKRAPIILGCILLTLGVLKVVMSWPYVPIWHHVIFLALLMPLAILGGKLVTRSAPQR